MISIWIYFAETLFFLFFFTAVFPKLTLCFFAPFLVYVISKNSLKKSLWIACVCGIFLDLFCSEVRFGLMALNFTLTTLILHRHKWHFFVEKKVGIFSFTAIFSAISVALYWLFLRMMGNTLPFTARGLLSNFVIMSIIDGIYAIIWFNIPLIIYHGFFKVLKKKRNYD